MIISPRGLTIYLPRNYAFSLIARLFPKIDAFKFLETVQGLEKTHGAFAFITGIVCFALQLHPIQIIIWSLVIPMLAFTLRCFGIFFLPGQIKFCVLYSRITGLFIITIILIVVGIYSVGFIGTTSFFIARIVLEGITIFADNIVGKRIGVKIGEKLNIAKAGSLYYSPINSFMQTYKFYARRTGASLDVGPTEKELQEGNWLPVWDDFAAKWPEVVSRYPQLNG